MLTSVGNCAHQQERWRGSFLRSYLGTSGSVPDYEYNVGGHYLSRYVCYYLGGLERDDFDASDSCVFSMSRTQIHQDRACRIWG